ncbi:MAG TPA: glycosyltransferase family 39 protein [Pyrinomonadaceae bacterium]|nr:glycosyltransferase family 39 protein [Pyrinomonadaceae bacterium]
MAAEAEAIVTAGLRPDLFAERGMLLASRTLVIATLALLVLAGFGFRVSGLSAEGLSEDELNKLNAVADYRQNGLTAANGEHPMLMKALQTASIFVVEKWNNTSLVASQNSSLHIPTETALRLPSTIFGALTVVLIYLLAAELFGAEVALLAAALWTFDPQAIGFNRIAKEDSFLLFFFLLANIFWLRGQRVAETESSSRGPQRGSRARVVVRPERYYWATAACFGAMMASKYLPQLITVSICYYWMFQAIPETRWRLGKKKFLIVILIMCAVFLLLSPTALLPATWREMGIFAGQKRIGHDSYEFMGSLYSHRLTDWLAGIPWYLYLVFLAVKLPVLTVAAFVAGLPLLFRRKLGDGRYFILFWLFVWTMSFVFVGGKFTRYFTLVLPAVLITAAVGVQFVGRWIAQQLAALLSSERTSVYVRAALVLALVLGSIAASASGAPYFRFYTNVLGGGMAKAGFFFPHDEFYDASMRNVMAEIARRAKPGVRVATETSGLAAYYAERAGRSDLVCISLSDPEALSELTEDDFVIDARGRRYFSNDALMSALKQRAAPEFQVALAGVPAADVYLMDHAAVAVVAEALNK